MPDDTNATPASPKLIIDSDWKNQAQAEKERLAAKTAPASPTPSTAGGPGSPAQAAAQPGSAAMHGGHAEQLPPANWQALLGTLVSQTLMYMGAIPDPETGRGVVSLEYARFHIDLLDVLLQKTKGNISPAEETELQQVLSELRLRYVELTQAVSKMYATQGAKGSPTGGAGVQGL